MFPNTEVDMTTDCSESTKKKPLPIYVVCVIYLCSGLKELFAGLWGPLMTWLFTLEEGKN
jgi:hypothetical protein